MSYYAIILLCLNLISIKEYSYFDDFEKRLIKISTLLSLSFVLFTILSHLSIEDLAYGPLLFLFNGPLLYYLLLNKIKYVLFQLYIIIALLFLYFYGFSIFSQNSIESINLFTSLVSTIIGISYSLYFMLFQTSTSKECNSIKKISCSIVIFTSLLSIPFFFQYLFGISCSRVFMFNYTLFILSAQLFLAWRYNQIRKENESFISNNKNISVDDSIKGKDVKKIEAITTNLDVHLQDEDQTINSLINNQLINNQLFLNSNLTLDDVALATNVSKPRLTAYFRKTQASNFNQYINRLRVEYSIILLQDIYNNNEANLTIEQLAFKSGFNSRVTFYRAFVNIYGFPPSELIRS